ncbi:MAG: DinB family protein [Deltaproteobacteria bacterium]|nr:DinB family protein [Deltaproteobacteria bacterium]
MHHCRVSLAVVDEPPDRDAWLAETVRLLTTSLEAERAVLLDRVAAAPDDLLARGTETDWGLGQIAVHLLTSERGIAGITPRLAKGEPVGGTGQPRPASGTATREGIRALAAKAAGAVERLQRDFPSDPRPDTRARHPFYGELNCFGWMLVLPHHYHAHRQSMAEGR